MKNIAFIAFSFLLLAASFTLPASAQPAAADTDEEVSAAPPIGQPGFPKFASDVEIATIYHKMTGEPVPFDQWARLSPKCMAEKTQTGRVTCIEEKAEELRQSYQLLTVTESIPVPFVPAIFSAYSKENGGYVIKNFTEETYMPFSYAGRNYALIPQGLMDLQFLPVEAGNAQKDVENALRGAQRKAVVLLYIQPTYADRNSQVELDGKKYTLISGKVTNIAIYKCRKNQPCTLLWEKGSDASRDAQRQDLMDLKR